MQWYETIITGTQNVDIWLPMPLLHMLSFYPPAPQPGQQGIVNDTPWGIAKSWSLEIQKSIIPPRETEFTDNESNALMLISMHRFRAGIEKKHQAPWKVYMDKFKAKWGWTPNIHRMRVLDLMFQIDLVYYFNGVAEPLHPFSKFWANTIRIAHGHKKVCVRGGV